MDTQTKFYYVRYYCRGVGIFVVLIIIKYLKKSMMLIRMVCVCVCLNCLLVRLDQHWHWCAKKHFEHIYMCAQADIESTALLITFAVSES